MSKPISALTTFQNQTGPIPLSELDTNFAALWNAANDMATYSNYLIDSSGTPNLITVTPAVGLAFAYTAGIWIEVKVANTNTSTTVNINVAALGNQLLKNPDGSNPGIGQLKANGIYALQYDGTNFQIIGAASISGTTGLFADGAAATPSISFQSDTGLGLYKSGTDILGFATAGVATGTLSGTVLTMPAIAVTGATVPNNGIYLSAANTLGFSTATTSRGSVNATGNWVLLAPSTGSTIAVTGAVPTVTGDRMSSFNVTGGDSRLAISTTTSGNAQVNFDVIGVQNWTLGGRRSDGALVLGSAQDLTTNVKMTVASAGNFSFSAPTSGKTTAITGVVPTLSSDRIASFDVTGGDSRLGVTTTTSGNPQINFDIFGVQNWAFGGRRSDGALVFSPTQDLTSPKVVLASGGTLQAVDDAGTLETVGWRDCPNNSQTASYQLVLADRGKSVDFNGASLTCTIPANGTVAFPIGTAIVITNLNASNLSIAITTDTLTLAGTTTTGTRTLAQNGMATILKVTSTSWLISGAGLS